MMSDCISQQEFELFKDALIEENLEQQVLSILKLQPLAKALGEEATREDLLPFIAFNYGEFHDEVLLNLAEELLHFVPLVGGFEHAEVIFNILQKLCLTDENIVRERAVRTIIALQQTMSRQQIEDLLLPVINALTKNDWFTSKCSAVMMFSPLYPRLGQTRKAELRNNFKTLIQDDSSMVRKAAAIACVDLVQVVEDTFLEDEFVPIFQDIAQDPMDSVRVGAIDIALALMKRLHEDGLDDVIFKTLEDVCDDASWRLRQSLALSLATLQQQLPYGKYRCKLLALYQQLAQDAEAEVRVVAASSLFRYCGYLKESYQTEEENENNFEPVFEQSVMAIIRRLALDDSEEVRLALSSNVLPLSTLLSEQCFEKNIIAFLLEVLSREDSIMIQTNFLLGLSNFSGTVDLTQSLSAIKGSVQAVIARSQANWRTRRSILLTLVDIARFCDSTYFSENFQQYYTSLLEDPVFAVRRSASLVLPVIAKHYGIKWAREYLVEVLEKFCNDSRYLYRFVALFGIAEMVQPQLFPQPESCLEGFRKLLRAPDPKAHRALAKIAKSCRCVQRELSKEKYQSILKLKGELNYSSSFLSDIYTEAEFAKLKALNGSVYSVGSEDLGDCRAPYLQGVLQLIHNTFLPIIRYLNGDPTENVQIGAICTLGLVWDFIARLSQEEAQEWVQEACRQLPSAELEIIQKEVEDEFISADYKPSEPLESTPTPITLTPSYVEEKLDFISLFRTITLTPATDESKCGKPKTKLDQAEKRVLPLI
uniref:TOG domain-containing protein n=2 Tax=Dendroctonus ponderosae TaxID=77166 RepID=A0AAR5Q066_DENPD